VSADLALEIAVVTSKETYHIRASVRFIVTYLCNQACTYCHVQNLWNKTRPVTKRLMRSDILLGYLKRISSDLDKISSIQGPIFCRVSFYGGEPFLNWKAIKEACQEVFLRKHNPLLTWMPVINTNGTLIRKDHIDFLKEVPNLRLHVSLDGFRSQFNYNRKYKKGGRLSFYDVLSSLRFMISSGFPPTRIQINSCISFSTLLNYEFLDSFYSGLKELGISGAAIEFAVLEDDGKQQEKIIPKAAQNFHELIQRCKQSSISIGRWGDPQLYHETIFSIEIDPDGTLRSQNSVIPIKNAIIQQKESILPTFTTSQELAIDLDKNSYERCSSCEAYTWCRGFGIAFSDYHLGKDTYKEKKQNTLCSFIICMYKERNKTPSWVNKGKEITK